MKIQDSTPYERDKQNQTNIGDFHIGDGRLYKTIRKKDGEPSTELVGNEIHLRRRHEDIFKKDITYEIEFSYRNEVRSVFIPRKDLTPTKLQKHTQTGAPFLDSKTNTLYIEYLELIEDDTDTIFNCNRAGWIFPYDTPIYVHSRTYDNTGEKRNIQYCGRLRLEANGTTSKSVEALNGLIANSPPLATALCFGLSAVSIVPLGLDNQFIHVYGDSTTGKTTMLMLAASVHGYPEVNKGIVQTFFRTGNSFMHELVGNSGVIAAFDEVSAANFLDEKLIYQVNGGKDKGRMGDDAEADRTFQTTVLSTGESSISSRSNHNNGAGIRLLEYFSIQWTRDKAEAEAVKEVVCENYGCLGVAFARVLMEIGEGIYPIYDQCLEEVSSRLEPDNRLAQRMAKNIAGLYFTARLAAERLGLKIDTKSVLRILLRAETLAKTQQPLAERALDVIKSALATKWHLFGTDGDIYDMRNCTPRGGIGKIFTSGSGESRKTKRIIIDYGEYLKILKSNGFEDATVVGRELYKNGYIKCEKSGDYIKYYNRANFNEQKAVKVMDFYGEYFNTEPGQSEEAATEEEHDEIDNVIEFPEDLEEPTFDQLINDED